MLSITYNTITMEMFISKEKITKFYNFLMMMLTLEVCTIPCMLYNLPAKADPDIWQKRLKTISNWQCLGNIKD